MPHDAATKDLTTQAARHAGATAGPPTIFPCLSYRDAPAAIEWLCTAFGFEKQAVYPGPDGTIVHAELRLGNGMIMLGSPKGERPRQPVTGGPDDWDQAIYVVLDDVDAHHARVKASGARIDYPPTDQPYGFREYGARGPEGELWSFMTPLD